MSPGCQRCWSADEAYIRQFQQNPKIRDQYQGLTEKPNGIPTFNGTVRLRGDRLYLPVHTRKPTAWAIWSDFLHEDVPEPFIDDVLDVIAGCPQHIFMALTKRTENLQQKLYGYHRDVPCRNLGGGDYLPNLWIGFTAENQEWFDRRWEYAGRIPAAVLFVSHEPALGPIVYPEDFLDLGPRAWVIAGGETGAGARPMHPDWARSSRDQCQEAGVPFVFKQFGEWAQCPFRGSKYIFAMSRKGQLWQPACLKTKDQICIERVGKKAAGRLLDGHTWDQVPEVAG